MTRYSSGFWVAQRFTAAILALNSNAILALNSNGFIFC